MKFFKWVSNLTISELIILLVFLYFLFGCSGPESTTSKTVKEACILPDNYKVLNIKSPDQVKWIIKDRSLTKKLKHR